ncbi:MAG TPA: hypothetical protein VMD49_10775 [Steroidobacteraceae bacterium]|nr:hypothetical protein [Steroidobacteraceae bacterium]
MATHRKLDIATGQLRSAVMLYCTGRDRFSAITLAGAADVILSQLLVNQGKQNFSDQLMKKEAEVTGVLPKRAVHGRAINDMLMINAMKHLDPGEDEYLEMDVRVSALATVGKALANYYALVGAETADATDFMTLFKLWAQAFTPKGLDLDGNPIE